MKLNDAKNIIYGSRQVKKVYLGKYLIWPKEESEEPVEPIDPDVRYRRILAIDSSRIGNKAIPHINLNYLFQRNPEYPTMNIQPSIKMVFKIMGVEDDVSKNYFNIFGFKSDDLCLREALEEYDTESTVENDNIVFNAGGYGNVNNAKSSKPRSDFLLRDFIGTKLNMTYSSTNTCRIEKYQGTTVNYIQWKPILSSFRTPILSSDKRNGVFIDGLKIGACAIPDEITSETVFQKEYAGCAMRIYSVYVEVRYYDDGWKTYIKNLVPAIDTITGECGLYDIKNKEFFGRVGTCTEEEKDMYYGVYTPVESELEE